MLFLYQLEYLGLENISTQTKDLPMKKLLIATAVIAIAATAPALAADKMMMSDDAKATMMTKHYFSKIDTNNDGMISKEEHTAFGEKMFAEADANGDGNISMDEMKAMKMKEMADMKAEKGAVTSSSTTSTTTKTMMKK